MNFWGPDRSDLACIPLSFDAFAAAMKIGRNKLFFPLVFSTLNTQHFCEHHTNCGTN